MLSLLLIPLGILLYSYARVRGRRLGPRSWRHQSDSVVSFGGVVGSSHRVIRELRKLCRARLKRPAEEGR